MNFHSRYVVSYVVSSTEFYIQDEEQRKVSNEIIDQLNQNTDSLLNFSDPKVINFFFPTIFLIRFSSTDWRHLCSFL